MRTDSVSRNDPRGFGNAYRAGGLSLLVLAALIGPDARAQDLAPPTPGPAPATAREAALEDRLRKMEERNEALSRTVADLSNKLDVLSRSPGAEEAMNAVGGDGPSSSTQTDKASPGSGGGRPSSPDDAGSGSKPAGKKVPLKAFYDKDFKQRYGFLLQSEDQEFELRVNGLAQVDSRIVRPSQSNVPSDIDMPRTRLYFSGRVTRPIEYLISFQRSTNNFDILNAYLNFHFDDRFQVRAGRFKSPFTYEWTKLSVWEMSTLDRSPFALNFGPNRQVGVMGWGNLLSKRLEYAVGVFDGPRNSFSDFNSAKDVMAFVDYRPFFDAETKAPTPLNAFSVGGSVDAGRQDNPANPGLLRGSITGSTGTLSSTTGDNVIAVPFLGFNNNVRERGDRALWELHATYFYKSLGLLAAWDSGHNDFSQTTKGARPVHLPVSGYFVQATYMVTGETRDKFTLIQPLHPFDLRQGSFGLGALELQARVSALEVGREVFTGGLADPNLWTNRADFLDTGFNWYLNQWVKFQFDWQHASFAQPVYARPGVLQKTSDLFWLRLQCYF